MNIAKCQLCGNAVNINNGGAALMIAVCRNTCTNLTNVSFCKDCYNALLKEPIKKLAEAACVEWYGIDDESTDLTDQEGKEE